MGWGGSSKTTVNQYDPVASAAAAEIAQKQEARSEEMWQMYKNYFQDYEINQAKANQELLPFVTEASKATLQEQTRDLEKNREVKDALRAEQLKEIKMTSPIAEQFYKEATEGVDAGQRMGEMQTDVAIGQQKAQEQKRARLLSQGYIPGSDAYNAAMQEDSLDYSGKVASARTAGRKSAEDETYMKLKDAMAFRGRASGLPGVQSTQGNDTESFNVADPNASSANYLSGAGNIQTNLASRVMKSETSTDTGAGGFLGQIAGFGAKALIAKAVGL